jgi:hypothetical protein
MLTGGWSVKAVDGADVRLRSGSAPVMTIDVTAPVTSGLLTVGAHGVSLTLTLALDRLSTGNFLLRGPVAAARQVVTRHDAHALVYEGAGQPSETPWRISGRAVAGDIEVDLLLQVTPIGRGHPMDEIELVGSASMGTIRLPALGTIDDFAFDVDAKLGLSPT